MLGREQHVAAIRIVFLTVHAPGREPFLGGFVVYSDSGPSVVRFHSCWRRWLPEEEADILDGLQDYFQSMATAVSGSDFVAMLHDQLSNVVRCTDSYCLCAHGDISKIAHGLAIALLEDQ
jgi:hypothetical protein